MGDGMNKLLIIAATKNKHKLQEFKEIFSESKADILSADDAVAKYFGKDVIYPDPEETGKTFAANAFLKVSSLYDFLGEKARLDAQGDILIVADDSGLCVDALDGAPGVYSARYASINGENATDKDNVMKLLKEMENVPDDKRQAAFTCAISGILIRNNVPDYILITAEGKLSGVISKEPHGENGFGYDPVLFLPEYGKCVAEISSQEKNAISHRGQALRRLSERYYGLR